jgi:hypothetical protein
MKMPASPRVSSRALFRAALARRGQARDLVWFLPSEELGVATGENPGPSLICFRAEARGIASAMAVTYCGALATNREADAQRTQRRTRKNRP